MRWHLSLQELELFTQTFSISLEWLKHIILEYSSSGNLQGAQYSRIEEISLNTCLFILFSPHFKQLFNFLHPSFLHTFWSLLSSFSSYSLLIHSLTSDLSSFSSSRILVLNLLNLYTLMFSLFGKVDIMVINGKGRALVWREGRRMKLLGEEENFGGGNPLSSFSPFQFILLQLLRKLKPSLFSLLSHFFILYQSHPFSLSFPSLFYFPCFFNNCSTFSLTTAVITWHSLWIRRQLWQSIETTSPLKSDFEWHGKPKWQSPFYLPEQYYLIH